MVRARWIFALGVTSLAVGGCPSTTSGTDAGADTATPDVVDVAPVEDNPPVEDTPVAEDKPVPASGIGEPCEATGNPFPPSQGTCATGQLCLGEPLGFAGGYCTQACFGTARCPADSVCSQIQGYPVCLRRCATNADCRRMEGYVCVAESRTTRVCRLNDEPVGVRDDGSACFTTSGGDHPAPDYARTMFTGGNLNVSARSDSIYEAEGNVAVNPMTGAEAVSYISISAVGGGTSFMGVSHRTSTDMLWTADGRVTDPMLNGTSDPVLDFGRDGTLRMTFIGIQRGATGSVTAAHVRVTESTDNGHQWSTPRQVEPAGFCTGGICDKPWIVTGPGAAAGSENVYLGYLNQVRNTADLVAHRSEDGGRTWAAPVTLASLGFIGTSVVSGNLVQIATGPGGAVALAWSGLSVGDASGSTGTSGSARFGSPTNRVLFRRSRDGLRTLESVRLVSRVTDSPVYVQPPVGLDGDTVHVAYVTGEPNGAWDVVLATSTDGGSSWRYRTVNDDPEHCATHAFPSMVVDATNHVAHVTWLENRFGDGAAVYARCPSDPSQPCGRNQIMSDRPFRFTTGRNPATWHGDYQGVALTNSGEVVATWSDPRSGRPGMWVSRGRLP